MATPLVDPVTYGRDPVPAFGHGMLEFFGLDPRYINLNNASFGCLPHPVRMAYDALSIELESNPDIFIRRHLKTRIAEVRSRVAALIGATRDECVMVPNVASGINTILRNFPWKGGDTLITTNTAFHTIARSVYCTSDLNPRPTLSELTLNFPASHSAILSHFRDHLRTVKRSESTDTQSEQNVVVLFDSIISMPGILMPWKEMVQICKEEHVWSIIDAAHSLGQESGINLSLVDPDFWIANCNKWLYAKRGCAALYVPRRNQHIIKYTYPPGIGKGSPSNDESVPDFVSEFHWSGSTDIITALTVNAALDFRKKIGGEESIINYCHSLAVNGGKRLAEILGTDVMDSDQKAGELIPSMVNVGLPLPNALRPSPDISRVFDRKLLDERKIYASNFYHNGRWWTRVSAQIFNEMADFEMLGHALIAVCEEITADFNK